PARLVLPVFIRGSLGMIQLLLGVVVELVLLGRALFGGPHGDVRLAANLVAVLVERLAGDGAVEVAEPVHVLVPRLDLLRVTVGKARVFALLKGGGLIRNGLEECLPRLLAVGKRGGYGGEEVVERVWVPPVPPLRHVVCLGRVLRHGAAL